MMTEWVLRSILASAFVGVAALAADRALRAFRTPRRGLWAVSLAAAISLNSVAYIWPAAIPTAGIFRWISTSEISSGPAMWVDFGGPPSPEWPASAELVAIALPTDHISLLTWLGRILDVSLPVAWLMGSVVLLGAFLTTLYRTSRARRGWIETSFDGVSVLLSDDWGPAVVGLRKPAIVLPRWVADAPSAERKLVIAHEQQHVSAGDSRLLTAAAVCLVAMPLNPVLWWMRHRLHEAVETDCDARVLADGANIDSYIELLLQAASKRLPATRPLALAFARRQPLLERRLQMMTYTRPRRPVLIGVPLAILALGGVLVACELVALEPTNTAAGAVSSANTPDQLRSVAERTEVGTVTGIVTDRETGQPLANAQVFIEGTGIGTLTAADGRYALSDVPSGAHPVTVARAGYRPDRQPGVRVDVRGTTEVIHALSVQAVDAGTLLIRSGAVELQPPTRPQNLQPEPVARAAGGPSFTPYIVAPTMGNLHAVAEAIRDAPTAAGDLVLWAYIDGQGQVRMTRIVQSSGVDHLDSFAEAAIRNLAEFTPALNRDEPVSVWVQIPMRVERS